tara:strand:+ start:38133 stop:38318 length:186 start_codon:yes stop_codon:yes gene_type:complete
MENVLTSDELIKLRNAGVLQQDEVALRSGDLVVAENVVTKERRVLDTRGLLSEGNKRVLKG